VIVYHAEHAWLGSAGVAADVAITVDGGRITSVVAGLPKAAGTIRLVGLTLPGFVNAHSHAFHRALRGRVQTPGDFWAWRDAMYTTAAALTPESYEDLATAAYVEMANAGFTTVGEFHYLHHGQGGEPYADGNEMAWSLVRAAERAGIRLVVIDACYLRGGFDTHAAGVQLRFSDGDVDAWATRATDLAVRLEAHPMATAAVAAHSVRAVAPSDLVVVRQTAQRLDTPLHIHLSEQVAENEAAIAATGMTPTGLLEAAHALGRQTAVVHATHLTADDISTLGRHGVTVVACPTTERDLGDGLGPFLELATAGAQLATGTDSHAVVDPFEEARGIELHDRLRLGRRAIHDPARVLEAATSGGARSLGLEAGAIAEGCLADLTTIRLDPKDYSDPERPDAATVVFTARAAAVSDVIVAGRRIVAGGVHQGE